MSGSSPHALPSDSGNSKDIEVERVFDRRHDPRFLHTSREGSSLDSKQHDCRAFCDVVRVWAVPVFAQLKPSTAVEDWDA